MSVDANGVESLPSKELTVKTGINDVSGVKKRIELLLNIPNPAGDETTRISVWVNEPISYREAKISITDITGKEIEKPDITLNTGTNEVLFKHGYRMSGTYTYTLLVDGRAVESKKMVFVH